LSDAPDYSVPIRQLITTATKKKFDAFDVAPDTTVSKEVTTNPGRNLYLMLWCNYKDLLFAVLCDNTQIHLPGPVGWLEPATLNAWGFDVHTYPIALHVYNETVNSFEIAVWLPFEWQKSLKINVHNPDTVNTHRAAFWITYLKGWRRW